MRLIDADALQKRLDEIICDENSNGYIDRHTLTKIIEENSSLGFSLKALHERGEISSMACNALLRRGFETLFEVSLENRADLMKIRGLGRKSMNEIEWILSKYGLKFGESRWR